MPPTASTRRTAPDHPERHAGSRVRDRGLRAVPGRPDDRAHRDAERFLEDTLEVQELSARLGVGDAGRNALTAQEALQELGGQLD